jgi:hypothetical protein
MTNVMILMFFLLFSKVNAILLFARSHPDNACSNIMEKFHPEKRYFM